MAEIIENETVETMPTNSTTHYASNGKANAG